MTQTSQATKDPETIRSEIDQTRERMDQTIDALAERVKGRHLLDEILGFFRSSSSAERARHWKENVSHTTGSALHSVAESIKANPAPVLLIGAGITWMIYESARPSSSRNGYRSRRSYGIRGDGFSAPDYPDWPGQAQSSEPPVALAGEYWGASGENPGEGDYSHSGEGATEGTRKMAEGVKAKLSGAAAQVRERGEHLRERTREWRDHARERSRELYEEGRQQVAETVNTHPLSVGLGCLAVGVVAGLLIPTPRRAAEAMSPHARRFREQARETGHDLVERGRHVADAAMETIKEEAKHQGLTPEGAKEAAKTGKAPGSSATPPSGGASGQGSTLSART